MTFWVAGAVVVGGIAGAAISGNAAQNAADTQAQAAQNAQQISQNEFNTITAQEQPFLQSGYGAQSQLNYLLGIGSPGGATTGGQTPQTPAVQGYDPSSGYQIGPGGFINQLIPGGSGSGAGSGGTGSYYGSGGYVTPSGRFVNTGTGLPGSVVSSGSASQNNMTATQGMTAGGQPTGQTTGQTTGPPVSPSSPAGGFGSLLTPFTADYMKQYSPAYQFQLQQGQQGVLNSDAAGQGALSGAALKDLISYNQNYANTAFGNAFNQYQTQQGNIYSRLAGIAQLGQAAAANTGQQGTALAGQAAQSAQNIGTAQAAGQIGSANVWSGALSNVATPWLLAGGGGGLNSGWGSGANANDALAGAGFG